MQKIFALSLISVLSFNVFSADNVAAAGARAEGQTSGNAKTGISSKFTPENGSYLLFTLGTGARALKSLIDVDDEKNGSRRKPSFYDQYNKAILVAQVLVGGAAIFTDENSTEGKYARMGVHGLNGVAVAEVATHLVLMLKDSWQSGNVKINIPNNK